MKKVALIVAGGKGERMGSEIPKQFLVLKGLPILMHTIKKFSDFEEKFLVLPKLQFDYWKKLCEEYNFNENYTLVEGGESRFHSVKNGLEKIELGVIIAIHDGVRPLISEKLIHKTMALIKPGVGGVPIFPIKESIRKVKNETSKNIDRNNYYYVQTPQIFISNGIKKAYSKKNLNFFTDDASVFESSGGEISTVLGEEKNLKITTKNDLKIAEIFMR